MRLIKITLLSLFVMCSAAVHADEGMWLLALLQKQNEKQMMQLGLKMNVADIVGSENALNQAVVSFDGGCTASFISDKGLLLTNYHCSYNAIQKSSSVENNYIKNGFWTDNRSSEIPVQGLTILVTKKIEDVSDEVNKRLKGEVNNAELNKITREITGRYRAKYNADKVTIRSYKKQTIHILYVQQTFKDVRLVCAPPQSVAKFGGETDNWMWPRHNCDFTMFRVYASADNKPAEYAKTNVPYNPDRALKISLEGYSEDDFAMAIGFPGYTNRQASSMNISETVNALNPPQINIRTLRQQILAREMKNSEDVSIKYSAKFSQSANYQKNSVGINEWVTKLNLIDKKQKYEQNVILASIKDKTKRDEFAASMNQMTRVMKECEPYRAAGQYYLEGFGESCEMLRFVSSFGGWAKSSVEGDVNAENRKNFVVNLNIYYKNYDEKVDRIVTKEVIKMLRDSLDTKFYPEFFSEIETQFGGDVDKFVDDMYKNSIFANLQTVQAWMKSPTRKYAEDKAVIVSEQIAKKRDEISSTHRKLEKSIQSNQSLYYKYVADSQSGIYYPNADKTMRLTYGQIKPLTTPEGVKHGYQTYFSEVIKKEDPNNSDFYLTPKMKELWAAKDFGRYGANGDIPVSFIVNADVTGGNSGSPIMNAKGELIGLLYDCNWESMTRDYNFDLNLHRAICLDVRYMLYIVEKYGNAKHIINEILETKSR